MKRLFLALTLFVYFFIPKTAYAITGNISANPTSCAAPCNTTITWDTSSPAASNVEIMEIFNGSVASDQTPNNPSGSLPYSNLSQGSHQFQLIANGANSGSGTWSVTVNVSTATPTMTPTPTPTTAPTNAPAPTATPTPSSGGGSGTSIIRYCNESCGQSNQVCQSGLYCATIDSQGNRACRLQAYQDRGDCSTPPFSGSSSSTIPTPTSTTGTVTSTNNTPGSNTSNFSPVENSSTQVLGAKNDKQGCAKHVKQRSLFQPGLQLATKSSLSTHPSTRNQYSCPHTSFYWGCYCCHSWTLSPGAISTAKKNTCSYSANSSSYKYRGKYATNCSTRITTKKN